MERDFARRELDRACQETREALSREAAALRGRQEIAQWHEYANSVERALMNARLPLPPHPSQKACDVPTKDLCAVCEGVFIDHRHGAMGHDWQPKPQNGGAGNAI